MAPTSSFLWCRSGIIQRCNTPGPAALPEIPKLTD